MSFLLLLGPYSLSESTSSINASEIPCQLITGTEDVLTCKNFRMPLYFNLAFPDRFEVEQGRTSKQTGS